MSFRLSIISIFVFTLSSNSYSQGSYLERGQSGFGLGSSFTINKNISGFDGSASYCLRGIIDIGFAAGWFSLKEKIEGSNVSATAVSPFFNIHFLKQNKKYHSQLQSIFCMSLIPIHLMLLKGQG